MDENFLDALKTVYSKLSASGTRGILCGSSNFALQGMNVDPNDIDVSVAHRDLEKVCDLFSEYGPSKVGGLSSGEGQEFKIHVGGVEVQISGDYEGGFYYKQAHESGKVVTLRIESIEIPAFTLAAEAECYEHLGRVEKAEKIRRFIGG